MGLSTARTEADVVEFLSGVYQGHTTGTAVTMVIRNQNTRSGDYAKTADLLRPGHADYTAYAKYEGYQDARGGGHFRPHHRCQRGGGCAVRKRAEQPGHPCLHPYCRVRRRKDAPLSSSAGLLLPEPEPGHFRPVGFEQGGPHAGGHPRRQRQ